MSSVLSTWVFLGTMSLAILTYQDIKTMKIDDRYNWFMYGVNAIFIALVSLNIWMILLSIGLTMLINIVWNKTNLKDRLESGDISALTWIIIGFAFTNITVYYWFIGIFLGSALLYIVLKTITFLFILKKEESPLPFFPVILISYLATIIIFKIY